MSRSLAGQRTVPGSGFGRPRLGDVLLSTEKRGHVVVQVEIDSVRAEPDSGGAARVFKIDQLERIEVGLWQETAR